jgi:hypothetical protein
VGEIGVQWLQLLEVEVTRKPMSFGSYPNGSCSATRRFPKSKGSLLFTHQRCLGKRAWRKERGSVRERVSAERWVEEAGDPGVAKNQPSPVRNDASTLGHLLGYLPMD